MNRTSIGYSRNPAGAIAHALTRREVIAWGAVALGGLAMTPGMATTASAQSGSDGRQTSAQVSQRDLDALSTAGILC